MLTKFLKHIPQQQPGRCCNNMTKMKVFGKCHICLKEAKLSKDHVPPQSCGNIGRQELHCEFLFVDDKRGPTKQIKTVQNGIKMQTICENCNNALLGANYDKALENFYNQAKCCLQTNNVLGLSNFNIKININKVCRDICAKFLSMNPYVEEGFIGEKLRNYIFNEQGKNIPNSHLFFRFYPYSDKLFFARNQLPFSTHYLGLTSCLYFYPFAFMFVTKVEDKNNEFAKIEKNEYDFLDLFDYTTGNIEEEVLIPFNLDTKINPFTKNLPWPFNEYAYNFPFDSYNILFSIKEQDFFAHSNKLEIKNEI